MDCLSVMEIFIRILVQICPHGSLANFVPTPHIQKIGLNKNESNETVKETMKAALELFYDSTLSSEEVMDLIPVKPIAENEAAIKGYLNDKLVSLYEKIKS